MRARNAAYKLIEGKWRLIVEVDRPEDIPDGELELTIKPYRQKRSLNANAYMWVLVGKIAEETNLNPDRIYRAAVKEMGVSQMVIINKAAAKSFEKVWSGYGLGWFTERVDGDDESEIIRAYYGSSVYNRRQMAGLIDIIVQDCKSLGIETMTDYELAGLVDRWEAKDGKV